MLNAAAGDAARTNDLLAQLIRHIEWIDEQLSPSTQKQEPQEKSTKSAEDEKANRPK